MNSDFGGGGAVTYKAKSTHISDQLNTNGAVYTPRFNLNQLLNEIKRPKLSSPTKLTRLVCIKNARQDSEHLPLKCMLKNNT